MATRESFADHFSSKAVSYSQYRPGYPAELFTYLSSLCPSHDLVWDCAAGSGQAACQFSGHFDSVVASDASFEQIKNVRSDENLFHLSCLAEQPPFVDHRFDLITVAQALHWFDLDRFYAEVKRLLKPRGVLAVWSYGLMQINPAIDDIVGHFYTETVGPYWAFERASVENGYRDLPFPFVEIDPPPFSMQADWSLEQLLGYLSTWSAVKRYKEERGEDPLQVISAVMTSAWGDRQIQTVDWPLSLRLGTLE